MEDGTLIAIALLTRAQGSEVLGRLRDDIIVEVHLDSTGLFCCAPCQPFSPVAGVETAQPVTRLPTFDLVRRLEVAVEHWPDPGDIEVSFDNHGDWRGVERSS